MTPHRLPGSRWFQWIQNQPARIGVLTGSYLTAVMVVSLLVANRMPFLEPFAEVRNWAARILFALVMAVPVFSFARAPVKMFASSAMGWGILTLAYTLMGLWLELLYLRFFSPFHLFVLGMSIYGIAAVVSWVASLALDARAQPVAGTRRRL
jgi:hypothetical protein